MDLYERIMELGSMGYHCSQIIMIMTLETIGEENPQLVKAMLFPINNAGMANPKGIFVKNL